jgi:hypothetical protein
MLDLIAGAALGAIVFGLLPVEARAEILPFAPRFMFKFELDRELIGGCGSNDLARS